MPMYDLRSLVASWVRAQGGPVDPALYPGIYGSTVGNQGQLSIKPDGKRGVFLAFGLCNVDNSFNGDSKIQLNVEGLRVTYNGVLRSALSHGEGNAGILLSAWPAPIPIPVESSLTIAESMLDSADTLANGIYLLSGFHTSPEAAAAVLQRWGQLRSFMLDVQAAAASNGGNIVVPFTMPEQDPRMWIQEFCGINNDAAPGDLDFIRLSFMSSQLYIAQRISGSLSVALPSTYGQPINYIGRYIAQGDTVTILERISSTARRDFWCFLGTAGGTREVVEVGGLL